MLDVIYLGNENDVIHDIFHSYKSQSVFVNYLYFANLMHYRILEEPKETKCKEYKYALQKSSFLLVDGIALQLFYRFGFGRKKKIIPKNLNGTDLFPRILHALRERQDQGFLIHMARRSLYDRSIGKTPNEALVAKKIVQEKYGIKVNFLVQCPYSQRESFSFDWDAYKESLQERSYDIRVFCNFTGTPFQEIRSEKNRSFFEMHHVLVLNQGGTIDFLSGFEKRAPRRLVKSRVLETPWRIFINPKKNLKKFLRMFGIVRYWFFCIKKKIGFS